MAHLNTNPTHAHNHITRAAAAMVSWFTMFREEARWVLAGFYASPLSWSNWNLECWFLWWEKNPHESNKKLSPHMTPGRTRTQGQALAPLRDPAAASILIISCLVRISWFRSKNWKFRRRRILRRTWWAAWVWGGVEKIWPTSLERPVSTCYWDRY